MSVRVAMDNSSTDVNRLPPQGQNTHTHTHTGEQLEISSAVSPVAFTETQDDTNNAVNTHVTINYTVIPQSEQLVVCVSVSFMCKSWEFQCSWLVTGRFHSCVMVVCVRSVALRFVR